LTRSTGQVKDGDLESKTKTLSLKETNSEFQRKEFEKREKASLDELKKNIEKLIDSNPALQQFKKQLLLDLTSEGLRIQIVDEQNRPMFDTSSSDLKPYTKVILREIGKVLNSFPSKLSLSGHTDAALFGGSDKGYSNWELSSNRANASRREMIAGGMDEHKVLRVVGLASTVLFDKNDPLNSVNRRISIVVLNKRTEEAMLREDDKDAPVEVGAQGLDIKALTPDVPVGGKR
jgi:chemotaxis protein MotB